MVAALQEANARLRAENAELRAENAELRARVAELEGRVARLERLISRNSGNSSMPPSADDLPGKKPPEARPRGGGKRKPGKQPGAPGAYLAWNDHPDKTVDHFPPDTHPPPSSTASPSSPPSATPSPEIPGYRLFLPGPEPRPEPVTHGNLGITKRTTGRECSRATLPARSGGAISSLTLARVRASAGVSRQP